jgi:hypothetical protein
MGLDLPNGSVATGRAARVKIFRSDSILFPEIAKGSPFIAIPQSALPRSCCVT